VPSTDPTGERLTCGAGERLLTLGRPSGRHGLRLEKKRLVRLGDAAQALRLAASIGRAGRWRRRHALKRLMAMSAQSTIFESAVPEARCLAYPPQSSGFAIRAKAVPVSRAIARCIYRQGKR